MKIILILLVILSFNLVFAADIFFVNGSNRLTKNFDSQFKEALSHYPELSNVSIDVVGRSYNGRISKSRPKNNFIFMPKNKREYLIIINNDYSRNGGYLFDEVPNDAQVGLFGHELAHILDYTNKSNFGIIKFGISYLNLEKRKETEKKIDEITAEHGLKDQIYEFTKFVLEDKNSPQKYKEYRKETYSSPEEISDF